MTALVYVPIFLLLHCSPVLPDAEAEPQVYGGDLTVSPAMEGLQNVWQGFGEINQERDVREQCGLVDQCCGMETQGCCQDSGQKCFTVYERKCRYANKPVCQTMTKEACDTYPVKQCRYIQQSETRQIPTTECKQGTERKCFQYTGKECRMEQGQHTELFRWTNQVLEPMETRNITKCHDVTTCDMKVVQREETRTVPRRKCEQIPRDRRECSSHPVTQQPQVVPTLEYRIEYRRNCYKVNRPVCTQEPCMYKVVQQNICPTCMEPSYPGLGCGTPSCTNPGVIKPPGGDCDSCVGGGRDTVGCGVSLGTSGGVCGAGGDMCGVCRQQQVRLCQSSNTKCYNQEQEVCQQVPYRVPVPGSRTVQPPPKWEVKCEVKQEMVSQCKVVYETETVHVPSRQCQPGTQNKCFEYSVPQSAVVTKQMNETVVFPTSSCKVVETTKEHCASLPTRMDCTQREVPRTVRINRMLCDQERQVRYCSRVPYSYCKNVPGQECSMEPREVCQPSCQQSNYCNQCTQFAASGGFGQCSSEGCPNYYGSTSRI